MAAGRTVVSCEIVHGSNPLRFTLVFDADHVMFRRDYFTAAFAPLQVIGNIPQYF